MTDQPPVEDLLRELAPQVLGVLVRRHGQFDAAEDAVQEALLSAALKWPVEGLPDSPRSWLITVAGRRLVDEWRSESARRAREENVALLEPAEPAVAEDRDDTLTLLFLCCHPSLSPPSQLALTLRAVVISHARGLAGTPSRGQRAAAIAKASCAASSARSKSPRKPISAARTRPH